MATVNTDINYEVIFKYDFLIGDIYRILWNLGLPVTPGIASSIKVKGGYCCIPCYYFDYCGNSCYFENFCIKEDYTRQELEDVIMCHRLIIAYSPPYPKKVTSLHELQNMNSYYC